MRRRRWGFAAILRFPAALVSCGFVRRGLVCVRAWASGFEFRHTTLACGFPGGFFLANVVRAGALLLSERRR